MNNKIHEIDPKVVKKISTIFIKQTFSEAERRWLGDIDVVCNIHLSLFKDLVVAVFQHAEFSVGFEPNPQIAVRNAIDEAEKTSSTLITQKLKANLGEPACGISVAPYEFIVNIFLAPSGPTTILTADQDWRFVPKRS